MTRSVLICVAVIAFACGVRADDKPDPNASRQQTEVEKLKKELDSLRKRNEELAKKVEDLTTRLNELRNNGRLLPPPGGSIPIPLGQLPLNFPLYYMEKPPPPVLPNLRAEVTDVAGELLTISVGIDAGLKVGTVLEVVRTADKREKVLGTAKVTSALNLFPKQAIVSFTPASKVPIDKLKAEDLPRKGDQVRPPVTEDKR